jgi:hypothetical protein
MATVGAQQSTCLVTGGSWPQADHPRLNNNNCRITSPQKKSYNCIAWAATGSMDSDWWWPQPLGMPQVSYWPPGAPSEVTVPAFLKAFETVGYVQCADGKHEKGFEKVALYAKKTPSGLVPTHASRQLADGRWTSKMGKLEDIEHSKPANVCGTVYGAIVHYMKRPLSQATAIADDPPGTGPREPEASSPHERSDIRG